MAIRFDGRSSGAGLTVSDSIEQRRSSVQLSGPAVPDAIDPGGFCFPVDRACRVETAKLLFDQLYSVTLHDETGRTEANLDVGDVTRLEDRPQFVGLSGPIKLYCRIEPGGTIDVGVTAIRIELDRETDVEIGARSLHDRPAGTITTPSDPESMLEAISALPSALKTTTPERSWPTMRGHPPLIELGDELDVPDEIDPPESDVKLIVPPEYRYLFQAAPLAFYLGAELRAGPEPRLETPAFERHLASTDAFEDEVARLLKRVFFLDCLARTEGIFQYDLYERRVLEDRLPFDLETIYEASPSERLRRYLDIPYDRLGDHVPRWPLTAHVPSEPDRIELLPFVVNELGIVREPSGHTSRAEPTVEAEPTGPELVRSAADTRRTASGPSSDHQFVVPEVTDESIEHAWFGAGTPQGASKATLEAYRSQHSQNARNESIEILLVCNDSRMLGEHDLLDDAYGNRDHLPFDVHSEFGVDSDRLATLLTEGGYDFLHYIGHATSDGIECPDGDLDVRTLDAVDLGVFFLNACQSYEQGRALARRGAFGGVSTYSDVSNDHAIEVGEMFARLLNYGFSLRGALEIVRRNEELGQQYLIVGDGSADIAQSDSAPMIAVLESRDDGTYDFSVRSYSTKEFKLGTASESALEAVWDRHLSPGRTPMSRVDEAELLEYLTWTELPVVVDGQLRWNNGIGPVSLE